MIEILALAGFVFDMIGKVMVSFTAIMVHYRFHKEHRIDDAVFRSMRREQFIGIAGVVLIVIGFLLQFPSKL